MLLAFFFACAPEHPTDPADCDGLFVLGKAREDCRIEVGIAAFEKDPTAAEAWVQANISDSLQRDFVHLQVTMRIDPSGRYCGLIEDEVLKARCDERAHRPHLNRALPPGPPGAPPPGGATPPGGPTPPSTAPAPGAATPPGGATPPTPSTAPAPSVPAPSATPAAGQ